ncbi:MAG: DUF2169 domain-containing protein [Polyangiaceae bacterium]
MPPRAILRSPLRLAFFPTKREATTTSLVVIVKGTFLLDCNKPAKLAPPAEQRMPCGDGRYDSDELGSTLRYATDFVPFKPRADALLVGTSRTRSDERGRGPRAARVSFGVAGSSKTLVVCGERHWVDGPGGLVPSEPGPLRQLPLRYELAFGGPGYAANPLGKGFTGASAEHATTKGERHQLPNIELADIRVRTPRDTPDPAGFGPLDGRWAARRARAGTYDERWLRERWPWYPADFDFGYFNAAPRDQQIPYLKGDEALYFEGLNADIPRFDALLPGLRPRAFAKHREADSTGPVEEIPLSLDTLWVDADALVLVLVWRGAIAVSSGPSRWSSVDDIEAVMLAHEPLADPPLPAERYEDASYWETPKAREEELADEEEAAAAKEGRATPEVDAAARERAQLEEARELLRASNASPELIDKLSKISSLDAFLHVVRAEQERFKRSALADGVGEAAFLEGEEELRNRGGDPAIFRAKPPSETASEPLERLNREAVSARLAAKQSLARTDLSELDLSRLDFAGANLEEARLTRTILREARLAGADLTRALLDAADLTNAELTDTILEGANLERAKLTGADLSRANCATARCVGANFEGASLELADLSRADLSLANLTGAKLGGAQLDACSLREATMTQVLASRASLRKADATRADLSGATLDRANLSGAVLDHTRLDGANLREALLAGVVGVSTSLAAADLTGVRASNAVLVAAHMDGVQADESSWTGADLNRTSLSRATLERADLSEATLEHTVFHLAVMKGADLSRAKLANARLTKVNLFEGVLEAADLTSADCRGSNFFGSELTDVRHERARFERSNLKRTKLEGKVDT